MKAKRNKRRSIPVCSNGISCLGFRIKGEKMRRWKKRIRQQLAEVGITVTFTEIGHNQSAA